MARKKNKATTPVAIKSPAPFPVSNDTAGVLILLAVVAAVATIALTGTAFWLSYEHLHDVAAGHGLKQSTARAWAWPATVDMFIVVGEVLILRASLLGKVDPWAIVLATAGSFGSIALNVAGVGAGAQPMDYVVAAVPPVAALLAFGALMWQVHGALAKRGIIPVAAPSGKAAPRADAWVGTAPAGARLLPVVAVHSIPATPPVAVPSQQRGETLTTSEVAMRLNVKPETVRSWVHRGKLAPVATDPADGSHLFSAADVAALAGTP